MDNKIDTIINTLDGEHYICRICGNSFPWIGKQMARLDPYCAECFYIMNEKDCSGCKYPKIFDEECTQCLEKWTRQRKGLEQES